MAIERTVNGVRCPPKVPVLVLGLAITGFLRGDDPFMEVATAMSVLRTVVSDERSWTDSSVYVVGIQSVVCEVRRM